MLELEEGLECKDLLAYIKKAEIIESYGTSILHFYLATSARKKLAAILEQRSKSSLFDYFKDLPSFVKQMPLSLHFYLKTKRIILDVNG